jgi:hypothetical protein
MSTLVARALHRLFPPRESKTLILGLDAAGKGLFKGSVPHFLISRGLGSGKTTLLYRLKLGEIVTTIPTIGFNLETVDIITRKEIVTLTCWDMGGCDKIRPLIRHYFGGMSCILV